jgi:hypothetical protein
MPRRRFCGALYGVLIAFEGGEKGGDGDRKRRIDNSHMKIIMTGDANPPTAAQIAEG